MGILAQKLEKRLALNDAAGWQEIGLGMRTAAGVTVTPDGAMKSAAVFACVRVLAETVASLPLITYKRRPDGGKDRAQSFYLYSLLHDAPNPLMTSFEYREALMSHLALWGNHYSEIEIDNRGRVAALWPLRPDKMEKVERNGGALVYKYRLPNGKLVDLPGWKVFHARGLGDGLMGLSPVGLMKQAVGLGLAAEEFGARFFGNGAQVGGVLQHPGQLGEKAYQQLRQSWEARHQGLANSQRVAILEEGMTYDRIGIPPEEAQFLQTRKFQVAEIARIYRVPPHLIGDLERATFSNVEQQSIDFVTHTIRPWLVRLEQAIAARLMSKNERGRYFAEFLVDGLLRGDTASRYAAYATARQNGWMSANDVRLLENQNPIDGGDVYLVPLNMVPAVPSGEAEEDLAAGGQRSNTNNMIETRAQRSAWSRQRLQRAHVAVYRDVLARILRREINDVGNAARRMLPGNDRAGFLAWVRAFYDEHEDFIRKQLSPVMGAYVALVRDAAMEEIGIATADMSRFERSYLQRYAARHAGRSVKQINQGLDSVEDDPAAGLEEVFDNWRDVRPAGDALDETIRVNNGAAKIVYLIGGVTALRWMSMGENCPYCSRLNGKTIEISQNFLNAGESLSGGDGHPPLIPGRNIGHPPAHRGCDCMVVAG